MLMGQDNLSLFPTERRRVGNAALYMSRFGTGWIASGKPPHAKGGGDSRHVGVCIVRMAGHEVTKVTTRPEPHEEGRYGDLRAVDSISAMGSPAPAHRGRHFPSFRLPDRRVHGNRSAAQVHFVPEMQGMQVQNGLADLQGGPGVSGHPGGSQVQHGAGEVVGHVSVPHPAVYLEGQL